MESRRVLSLPNFFFGSLSCSSWVLTSIPKKVRQVEGLSSFDGTPRLAKVETSFSFFWPASDLDSTIP